MKDLLGCAHRQSFDSYALGWQRPLRTTVGVTPLRSLCLVKEPHASAAAADATVAIAMLAALASLRASLADLAGVAVASYRLPPVLSRFFASKWWTLIPRQLPVRLLGTLVACWLLAMVASAQPLLSPPPVPNSHSQRVAQATATQPVVDHLAQSLNPSLRVRPLAARPLTTNLPTRALPLASEVLPLNPPSLAATVEGQQPFSTQPALDWPGGSYAEEVCGPSCEDDTTGSYGEGGPYPRHWFLSQMRLRHSSTHGRAMGPGGPLRGTSWRNRPYEVAFDFGTLLMTKRPSANVRKNNDLFNAVQIGWDWDHYWGSQLRVGWSSPDLLNTTQVGVGNDDNIFISDASLLYYPWGDSKFRPYYRLGIGLTDLEYTNNDGSRAHEVLLTYPFGVGFKYQMRRWLVFRAEIMDNFAMGQNGTSTLHNITLTGGLEWRFGGRPDGSWGWSGRGGSW